MELLPDDILRDLSPAFGAWAFIALLSVTGDAPFDGDTPEDDPRTDCMADANAPVTVPV